MYKLMHQGQARSAFRVVFFFQNGVAFCGCFPMITFNKAQELKWKFLLLLFLLRAKKNANIETFFILLYLPLRADTKNRSQLSLASFIFSRNVRDDMIRNCQYASCIIVVSLFVGGVHIDAELCHHIHSSPV